MSGGTAGAVDLGGGVTVTAITDAVSTSGRPLPEAFPGDPAGGWEAVARRHPDTVGPEGRWRLPISVFLVRTPELLLLVDAGSGGDRTVSAATFDVVGTLPARLAELGVEPHAVQLLVFTHLHQDHVGWVLDPDSGDMTFPDARHVVHDAEWAATHAGDAPPACVEQSLEPLARRDVIDLVPAGPVAEGVELVPLPGHTPGHCAVVVAGASGRAVLCGDAFNHPEQVAQPDLPSFADADRPQAAATRRGVLARAAAGEWPLLGSAHLPGAWWSATATADGMAWTAAAVGGAPRG
jgi:glyoxylase-like metal-dependent hydrolase (beta-lactamase superfamily II)